MAKIEPAPVTVEAFLRWESGDDVRHELVDGRIVAMAPPAPVHGKLAANLVVALRRGILPPCDLVVEAGIRIPERNDRFYQADLALGCTPIRPEHRHLIDPLVIIEILSPATRSHDRGIKLADYRLIPSVQEILLISSSAWHVEFWQRVAPGWRVMDWIGRETRFRLETLRMELSLEEIYAGLEWLG